MHLLLLLIYILTSRDISTLAAPAQLLTLGSSEEPNEKNDENNIFRRKIYHRAEDPQHQTSAAISPPLGTGPVNSTIANATSVVSVNITLSSVIALTTTPVTLTLASPSSAPSQGPIVLTSESPVLSQGPSVLTSVSLSGASSATTVVCTPLVISSVAPVSGSIPSPLILTLSPPPPTPILVTITPIPVNTVTVILSPIANPGPNPTLAVPSPGSTITVTVPVAVSPPAAGRTITVTDPAVFLTSSAASTVTITLPTIIASASGAADSTITITAPIPPTPVSFISTTTVTITGSPPDATSGDATITISAIPISVPTTASPLPPPPPTPVGPPAVGEEGGRTVTLVETIPLTSISNGVPVNTIWEESTSLVVIPQASASDAATTIPLLPPPPPPPVSGVNTDTTVSAPVNPAVLTVTVTAFPEVGNVSAIVADVWTTTVVVSADDSGVVPIITTVALATDSTMTIFEGTTTVNA